MKLEERRNFFTSQMVTETKIMAAESVISQTSAALELGESEEKLREELDELFEDINSSAEEIVSLHDEIETCKVAFEKQKASKGKKIYELIEFMPGVNSKLKQVMRDYER